MIEYTRKITGVISKYSICPYVDDKRIEDIVAEMIGNHRNFAGTISIVITDLTEDTGPVCTGTDGLAPEPDALPAPELPVDRASAGYTPCDTERSGAVVPAPTDPPEEESDAE